MNRRGPRTLLLNVLSLVAFLTAGAGDLLVRHPCPHHDALPGPVAGVLATPESDAEHDGHGPAEAGSEQGPASDHHDSGACNCLGHCAAGVGPATLAALASVPVAAAVSDRPLPDPAPQSPLRAPTPHRLHLPNAPPLSV